MFARRIALIAIVVTAIAVPGLAPAAEPDGRWVAATPDALIDLSKAAALKGGPDALARLLLIAQLEEQASARKATTALDAIAKSQTSVAAQARWLRLAMQPEPTAKWPGLDKLSREADATQPSLLTTFAILGPFEDTGGGLTRREGPEAPGHRFVDADYSWGVYSVRTQRSIRETTSARGLPLDLYVHPRSESCSYLSSVVAVVNSKPFVLNLGASGSFRLQWDGKDIATDERVHSSLTIDRAAVRIATTAGDHLLTVKVCSGARPDVGRVRIRFSDEAGRDRPMKTSSELARLDRLLERLRANRPATTAAAVVTPYQVAVGVDQQDAAPTPEQALTAAIVLTIAGTDDLRSLKSPGLLDVLVDGGGVSADKLALAGYIATSGANRSGWLTQAMDKARAAGDAATLGFAQRALVRSRLAARSTDLAKATADQPPLSNSRDAHARQLRATVLSALGGSGLRTASLRRVEEIARTFGRKTPTAVWRSVARLSSYHHPAQRLDALRKLAEASPGERGSSYVNAHRMMGSQTLEQLALDQVLHQTSTSQLASLGSMLESAGRYAAASQIFSLVTELSPNYIEGHFGLARVLRAQAPHSPASQRTLDALKRATELRPQDTRTSAELRFRKGDKSDEPEAGEDAQYIVDAQVFLDRAKAQPAPPSGLNARQLHWRRVVRFHPDKRVSQMMHYAREIIIEPRTEDERYERMPGGYGGELLVARLHRKDGSIVPPEEQDAAGPMVRWPKLKRGDVVEIAIRTWTPGPVGRRGDSPFYFIDYVGSTDTNPVLYNEVIIDAPKSSPLAFDVIGGKADDTKVASVGDRKVTRLIWNNPPSIPDEPFAPNVSEMLPLVVGSIYPSWGDFLSWYQGAIEGFLQPDEQIKRMAEEITEGKRTREEKVEALFNFVSDDIRYVNYQSGEWWLPNRPQQLLARRQGDCDDKAMLLISLLKAVGIEATEVLIQTRYTAQRRVLGSKKAIIPMFDHGIVWLPNEDGEGGRFLDATSPRSRLGSPPSMDSGAMAILVEDGASILPTPKADSNDHGVDARWKLELNDDGGGKLSANERHVGDSAFRLRTHLKEEDTRAQWVERNLIAGWLSAVQMSGEVTFDSELRGGQARVRYGATSTSLARREGKDLVLTVAPPMPITAVIAPLTKRTLPVELPPGLAPNHRRMTIEVEAPDSHAFAPLPPDAEENGGPFGQAKLSFKLSLDKRKVTIRRDVTLTQSRIEVADYQRWRRWLQKVDALMHRGLRLVPQ